MADISVTESQNSRLLNLAAELRNSIYQYALISDTPICINQDDIRSRSALIQVCKQIREEASQSFYAENKFFTTAIDGNCDTAISWLKAIGKKNAGHMHRLIINLELRECALDNTDVKFLQTEHDGPQQDIIDAKLQRVFTGAVEATLAIDSSGLPSSSISVAALNKAAPKGHPFKKFFRKEVHKRFKKSVYGTVRLGQKAQRRRESKAQRLLSLVRTLEEMETCQDG